LVIGAGPIGLGVIKFAQLVGAVVQVVEHNPWRRKFAEAMGLEALATMDGRVADVLFDVTGSAASMRTCL
jgi:threonine dehydrogenase-like Zn-dependent dehydrogenase